MKIFSAELIRQWDAYTIQHEPIASIDLMERASRRFVQWFKSKFPNRKNTVHIFCGTGNNGGDGFAVARLLSQDHYPVKAYQMGISNTLSPDCETNLKRLQKARTCPLFKIETGAVFPEIEKAAIVVDAIFGSGLNRPIEGYWATFIQQLNQSYATRIAIDIPSGMFADCATNSVSFQADFTFSFEIPKIGFFMPENEDRVGEWNFGSIGLHPSFLQNEFSPFYFTDKEYIKSIYRLRKKFSHKGTYGHALLIAGSYGSIGAAVLAAKGVLKSGVGLLTVQLPKCGYEIMQTAVPEAMVVTSSEHENLAPIIIDFNKYSTIGVGCGMGQSEQSRNTLNSILNENCRPMVLDADALNIIAANPGMFDKIPKNSILTPHPKEFERLFGKTADSFERIKLQREKAAELGLFIILKGAHTSVACPDGSCHFNSTGNPGMATGGSGDVLTGIITGLMAQGYPSKEAAILGVYLHGLAGDLAAEESGQEALVAGDIVEFLGKAFKTIK